MDKSIIIIGAGIAGLSAGCYARMNGYRTRIFELHDKPGGLCTAWKRNGYTFDGCVHWLVGTRPQTRYNLMWQELGAVQGREIIQHQEFMRVEARGGKCFTCYSDLDKLEGHMKDLSPADDEIITEFCNAARALVPLGEPMDEGLSGAAYGIKVGLMMLPLMPIFEKYSRITVQEFAGRFKDPFLRYAFPITFDQPDFSMLAMLMTLAWMHCGDAGYPVGGSLPFARSIEKRYLDLGGEVHYKKRVLEIIVEDDTAVGVCLADGTEHRADRLISAGDGHNTIFSLLHGRYTNETIRKYYNTLPIFASQIQVSLGVSGDFSDQPHKAVIQPSEVIEVAGEILDRISIRHYGYDPTMAPNGKSVLIITFKTPYDYWKKRRSNRAAYNKEKKKVADLIIKELANRFPGIAEKIEAIDVATPVTYERYTANWKGAIEGWLVTPDTIGMAMADGMGKTLPGLKNFYMAGQWVEPGGGIPPAAISGKKVIEMICKQDGKPFKALKS